MYPRKKKAEPQEHFGEHDIVQFKLGELLSRAHVPLLQFNVFMVPAHQLHPHLVCAYLSLHMCTHKVHTCIILSYSTY